MVGRATTLTGSGCLTALSASLLLGLAGEARAAIPASERAALIALYSSTNGPGWSYRGNWRNAEDTDFAPPGNECTWFGVLCDASKDHVAGLSFQRNNLSGPIPPEIGNLVSLETLSITYDHLAGAIPAEIGNLANLTGVDLHDNQLSGPLPREIGNLTHLSSLELYDNQLTGPIPPEIGGLSNARSINLDNNQLSGPIPHEVGNLQRLYGLSVGNNQLTGAIPPEIFTVGAQWLDLGRNQLSGPIPPEIGNVGTPSALYLDNNQLTGPIPSEIGNIVYVEELHLEYNQLSGPIPPEIFNIAMAVGMHHAGTLRLDHNQLSGPIPPEIGSLYIGAPWVGGVIHLEENRLSGRIPAEIGNISNLGALYLQGNRLEGPIPTTLAKLTTLGSRELHLSWNGLYTRDAALRTFLDAKAGVDWELTQTVPPTGLAAGGAALGSIPLSWSPIPYTGDTGGYRLWYATRTGGPYNLAGTTGDKTVSASAVSGLSPGTTYYFALDTVTEPHANNPNTVVSERTREVSATTLAGGAGWFALTVVADGPGTVSSSPGGIACGGACSATFAPGAPVTLSASAEAGWTFLGWGGACTGTAAACDLTMDAARTVTASFGPLPPTSYYTVTPCRAFDSRDGGASGALAAGTAKAVPIAGYCDVPATARAVSLNVTVVSLGSSGHLRLYASGTPRPGTSSLNYASGQTRANDAVVSLGTDGALIVYAQQPSGTVHVVIDVTGYFQ